MDDVKRLAIDLCVKNGDDPNRIVGRYEMVDGQNRTFYAWEYYIYEAELELKD